jgi:hypothetical protein
LCSFVFAQYDGEGDTVDFGGFELIGILGLDFVEKFGLSGS